MTSTLRTIATAVLSRAMPLALPAGMMMAEIGLVALRTEVDQLTTERDQLELECEQRRAYLAGGPDYLDVVDQADEPDVAGMFGPVSPTVTLQGIDMPVFRGDVVMPSLDEAIPLNYENSGAPPLAADYLREGWTYDGKHWNPPTAPDVDPNLPPIATVDPNDPEPRFATALTTPALGWIDTPGEKIARVCVDDGAEVLTVWDYADRPAPGILICTKCERTAAEPPELVAERVKQLAEDAATPGLSEHDPKQS